MKLVITSKIEKNEHNFAVVHRKSKKIGLKLEIYREIEKIYGLFKKFD